MAQMQATLMNAKIERLCRDVKERERTALNQSNNGLLAINVPKRLSRGGDRDMVYLWLAPGFPRLPGQTTTHAASRATVLCTIADLSRFPPALYS